MNKKEPNSKISGQLCVVSDVHIRSENDERYLKLCDLIENLDVTTFEYLILNGDIFEFFLGHRKYFRKKYDRLLANLDRLNQQGVRVYFIEGNHEFHVADLNTNQEIFCDRDLVLQMKSGEKVAITHGDLLIPDWKYRAFRAFVKSMIVRIIASVIPSAFFNEVSLILAKKSRARDAYRELDYTRLLDSAEDWLEKSGADLGIFGHFHVPFYFKFSTGKYIASVSDWSKPSALILKDGKVTRLEFLDHRWIHVEPLDYPPSLAPNI